ncbi:hypothetical protein [Natrialba asiatica]|uniref:Exonuclease RecJ n=1 Tax=Natrialba asiatica (strain ATCC 700177 / DSM 12278 / JCM 9576 / FERM P-10747 / NBRC 102637 / 172P1) TaxID=29540 RepID=M0AL52_NATA1|nr:hypothetical protein [Natrialba asiatica]ELY99450.1 exonuclease RecJ [Natrialba asiatica DSM 12278]
MSTDGHAGSTAVTDAPDIESAGFVRIVTRADGDALAASGILAAALSESEIPFQMTVARTVGDRTDRVRGRDERDSDSDELTVVFGAVDVGNAEAVVRLDSDDRPATLAATDLVREFSADGSTAVAGVDPVLALAGLVAAGVEPGAGESEWLLESARERGLVERRPGVAVPTVDPIDGLANSTRLCAPWSGDPEATRDALAGAGLEFDEPASFGADAHRTIGSLVALDVVGTEAATEAAATSIQRVLQPYAITGTESDSEDECAFPTVGGYADVLEATARTEPGTGAALAMGHDAVGPALSAWRTHGKRAHGALETASTGRYDGLFVVDIDDGPVEAVARMAVEFRSPEPTVLAIGDGEAAIATRASESASLAATVEAVARELDADGIRAEYDVGPRRGYLQYGVTVDGAEKDESAAGEERRVDNSTIIAAVREHY